MRAHFATKENVMKVFVWSYISNLTDSYHSGGGLIVFAETEERAKELASAEGVTFTEDDSPNDVRAVDGGSEAVYIMPDAGCC
jgi:hypothetical protein